MDWNSIIRTLSEGCYMHRGIFYGYFVSAGVLTAPTGERLYEIFDDTTVERRSRRSQLSLFL